MVCILLENGLLAAQIWNCYIVLYFRPATLRNVYISTCGVQWRRLVAFLCLGSRKLVYLLQVNLVKLSVLADLAPFLKMVQLLRSRRIET